MHRKISYTMPNLAWCAKFFVVSRGFAWCANFAQPCKTVGCWISSSDFLPCISDWLGKGSWSAPKLGFFMYLSFNLHCHGFHKILPHSWLVSMIKKLPKTPKLAKSLLVTLARVLNVPIELKGINYYSKVFKIVNFKL